MTGQIAVEAFTGALLGVFEETFERGRGMVLEPGTSLFETLATVAADEASRPVSASCASIAAQVDHLCFALELVVRLARGEAVGEVDWQASWRRGDVTPEGWAALQGRLRDAHRDLLAVAGAAEAWRDPGAIGGAFATVAHTAFHLGQIRQALCTVRRGVEAA